ncbi:hypothetical protein ABZV38_40495, partial [Streptomyces sp. NPDC005181]
MLEDGLGEEVTLDHVVVQVVQTRPVRGQRPEAGCRANHSPDNIFIYAPAYATLMVVDVIYPGWVPFRNLAV